MGPGFAQRPYFTIRALYLQTGTYATSSYNQNNWSSLRILIWGREINLWPRENLEVQLPLIRFFAACGTSLHTEFRVLSPTCKRPPSFSAGRRPIAIASERCRMPDQRWGRVGSFVSGSRMPLRCERPLRSDPAVAPIVCANRSLCEIRACVYQASLPINHLRGFVRAKLLAINSQINRLIEHVLSSTRKFAEALACTSVQLR